MPYDSAIISFAKINSFGYNTVNCQTHKSLIYCYNYFAGFMTLTHSYNIKHFVNYNGMINQQAICQITKDIEI